MFAFCACANAAAAEQSAATSQELAAQSPQLNAENGGTRGRNVPKRAKAAPKVAATSAPKKKAASKTAEAFDPDLTSGDVSDADFSRYAG